MSRTARAFEFDAVLDENASQDNVYSLVAPYVASVVRDGFNATVMAYGQTGSGKTHTMMGSSAAPGVIPRAIDALYALIEQSPETTFMLDVSFVELYNENFFDLLHPDGPEAAAASGDKIAVREAADKSTFLAVRDASGRWAGKLRTPVASREQLLQLLHDGMARRRVMSTLMNSSSSRSHALFSIYVESSGPAGARAATLHLVDLAGAESIKASGVTGVHAKEATSINKSLSALGDVLAHLSTARRTSSSAPYRNSPLTFFLRDSLGGSAKTLLIATVRQELACGPQTKSVLVWAARARQICNKPVVHAQGAGDSRIRALEAQLARNNARAAERISQLEALLASRPDPDASFNMSFTASLDELEAEKQREAAEREALEAKLAFLINAHNDERAAQDARVASLEAKLSATASDLKTSEQRTAEALANLEAVTASLNINKAEAEDHAAKIQALTRQWCDHSRLAQKESASLKARLKREHKKRRAAEAAAAAAAASNDTLAAELATLRGQLSEANAQVSSAFGQISRLLVSANKAQASKDSRIAELEALNARLEAQLSSKDVPSSTPARPRYPLAEVN
ncbi:uncharacterized protein AMSG_07425 [Thecamonas trahens ATCC 50062]|uniref:Kinesin-like protein n=1 Tax=Thecamonas trahens ATCC 50062 TaxID=461836 RepID=A0A0L0DJQ7_THETB|nr:hypothetical protein AMSG_07425 [Thecamonas trahens ATCC 50062]KNC51528.1 hypothetical protein AMSG_07425 [Thecamonas trahens ATCC 50062]|eukprot:XP_013755931.1 hypothetical protein AMSG_07425 [Thecamonas trahens ATCC 50062]